MSDERVPAGKAAMLIRKPVSEVFQAFVDPNITTKFWFTKSTGKLTPGARVRWDWEMFGISADVHVKELEVNKRIVVEWLGSAKPTTVEWVFTARSDGGTFVEVTHAGFEGTREEIVEQAIGSAEGFALSLAGLKALLEHDVKLNLVADRFPDGLGQH